MARPKYPSDPDGTVDVDRVAGPEPHTRSATRVLEEEARRREQDRAGHGELDVAVEALQGLTRAARDRARATPRERSAPLGHPRKARAIPPGAARALMSSRQRDARSRTKYQVMEGLSGTQHRELGRLLVQDLDRWDDVNDAISEAAGDVQALPEATITQIQRVDRAIQAYEAASDRSHVLYSNVQMPPDVTGRELGDFTRATLPAGTELALDRFTLAAHDPHEVEPYDHRGVVVMEIATRRGMYVGQSGNGSQTGHLLPRGMRLWVTGITRLSYARPDGSTGRRTTIQLTDTPPAPSPEGPTS